MKTQNTRLASLEFGRLLAVFCVVAIHVQNPNDPVLNFGVPYFFALSGYLLSKAIDSGEAARGIWLRFAKRHLMLFAAWAGIYTVLPLNWPMDIIHHSFWSGVQLSIQTSLQKFLVNPWNWLLDGPPGGFHLWYMVCSPLVAGIALLAHRIWPVGLLVVLMSAALCVLLKVTSLQCVGDALWATNAKLGIWVGLLAFGVGWVLAITTDVVRVGTGALMVLFSLTAGYWMEVYAQCPSIVGVATGCGLLALLTVCKRIPAEKVWLAAGRLTLGVYLLHIALRPLYFAVQGYLPGWGHPFGAVLLVAASIASVWAVIHLKLGRILLT